MSFRVAARVLVTSLLNLKAGVRRGALLLGAQCVTIVFLLSLTVVNSAQAQSYSILYTFTGGADGAVPFSLLEDDSGNFDGVAGGGGSSGNGVLFKFDSSVQETVVYNFEGEPGGREPRGRLVRDASGNLYGVTRFGGDQTACGDGCGVVFKLDTNGNQTVLHTFHGTDGAYPLEGLVQDAAGNLYGTTSNGGLGTKCYGLLGCGTVFKLDPGGNLTVLYNFTGGADGATPFSGVILDSAGNLYGTAAAGGTAFHCGWQGVLGCGVIFKLDSNGSFTTLYSFPGPDEGPDGANPVGGLALDAAGNLYGTTARGGASVCSLLVPLPPPPHLRPVGCGTVFKIDTTGVESVLYRFTGGNTPDGAFPQAGLVLDASGNVYGTTHGGGSQLCFSLYGATEGCGTVFMLDTAGTETLLHTFNTGGLDGFDPGAVLLSQAGNLYGTTEGGGTDPANEAGTIYEIAFKDFTLEASALTPATVGPGSSSTSTVNLTAVGDFAGSVTLSCSVDPTPQLAPQCSVSPGSITPGTPATLTVTTTAPRAFHSNSSGVFYAAWLPLLGWIAIGSDAARRRKRVAALLGCLLFTSLLFQAACGGGGSSDGGGGGGTPGTPAGTYTITVTGVDTSGTLQHSATATLAVQ